MESTSDEILNASGIQSSYDKLVKTDLSFALIKNNRILNMLSSFFLNCLIKSVADPGFLKGEAD